ncbi:hypothetical protein GALL_480410 [mine drainage metagenome]|uniref:Uncharacterized protein n=1 Tax=mine drainage metagenome TaxID=410659 RepID=A0A1J5PGL1_9ZZZZ
MIQADNPIAMHLPERGKHQVAKRMPTDFAATAETVLHDIGPAPTPDIVGAECCQRHPQIARGQDSKFTSKTSTRAPIIGNRDDGRDPGRDGAQCGERGC